MPNSGGDKEYRLDFVKICGITNLADRDLAADAGADYFGALVDVGYSPRTVTLDSAALLLKDAPIPGVIVLLNPSASRIRSIAASIQPHAIQLLGNESPDFIASIKNDIDCELWKSIHIPAKGRGLIDLEEMDLQAKEYEDAGVDAIFFSTVDNSGIEQKFGGTGMVGDWGEIRKLSRNRSVPVFVAGGVVPENAASAVQTVRPSGIDLCSGIESSPGKKDPRKIAALFEAIKSYR